MGWGRVIGAECGPRRRGGGGSCLLLYARRPPPVRPSPPAGYRMPRVGLVLVGLRDCGGGGGGRGGGLVGGWCWRVIQAECAPLRRGVVGFAVVVFNLPLV